MPVSSPFSSSSLIFFLFPLRPYNTQQPDTLLARARRLATTLARRAQRSRGRCPAQACQSSPVSAPPAQRSCRLLLLPLPLTRYGAQRHPKWVGVVRSIWADHLDAHLRGIFPLGTNPTHSILKPNTFSKGFDPT
jgi:hypothetical protein